MSTENSTEYANYVANPPRRNRPDQQHGRLRIASFTHTQAAQGAAGSKVNLCVLPAGRGRILKKLSYAQLSALGASRTLDIGHTGWTKTDGTAQAASADIIEDGRDVSSATAAALGVGTNADDSPVLVYDSKTPIVVRALVAGDTLDLGETIDGYIVYVLD
jgi:hypothetical protein